MQISPSGSYRYQRSYRYQWAMDAYHGLDRESGTTVGECVTAHTAAAEKSLVGGLLNDSALVGELGALSVGHLAYHREVIKRNGATVPKKSVLSGGWFRAAEAWAPATAGAGMMEAAAAVGGVDGVETAAAVGGAEGETAAQECHSGEQATGLGGRDSNFSPGAGSGRQNVVLSSVVSLWLGSSSTAPPMAKPGSACPSATPVSCLLRCTGSSCSTMRGCGPSQPMPLRPRRARCTAE